MTVDDMIFEFSDDRLRGQRESKIISTGTGISIVFKQLSANANSSIRCIVEFDSNVIDINDVHLEKQHFHTISTDAGISIVFKPLSANANSSIRCNFEFNSNATDVSDLQ
jgi:hypothetical protein